MTAAVAIMDKVVSSQAVANALRPHSHHHHHPNGAAVGMVAGAAVVGVVAGAAAVRNPQIVVVQQPRGSTYQPPMPTYHQPRVVTPHPPVLMEGWVCKRAVSAPSWLKNWKRRHVRLLSNRLEWRRAVRDIGPAGYLPIVPMTSVSLSSTHARGLEVKHGDSVLLFECADDQVRHQWFQAISAAIAQQIAPFEAPVSAAVAAPMPAAMQPSGAPPLPAAGSYVATATAYPVPSNAQSGVPMAAPPGADPTVMTSPGPTTSMPIAVATSEAPSLPVHMQASLYPTINPTPG